MRAYTDCAFCGDVDEARRISASLEPVRQALKGTRPGGKPHAHQKFWQDLLGQRGGSVRRPMLELSDADVDDLVEFLRALTGSNVAALVSDAHAAPIGGS